MKVQATKDGYYDLRRQRAGDVFTVRDRDFSAAWMVEVDPATPERHTTAQQRLGNLERHRNPEGLTGREFARHEQAASERGLKIITEQAEDNDERSE